MARYQEAVEWIALNDAAGDTPEGMPLEDAFHEVRWIISVALVSDIFGKERDKVALDVLKERGFAIPRGWSPMKD